MTNFMDLRPTDCRLTEGEWRAYREAAQRGRIFLPYGRSPFAMFNRWWQGRRRGTAFKETPSHIGIIGSDRGCYESLIWRGPTRDFNLDRYLMKNAGKLQIAELTTGYEPKDVIRAFEALHHYMWRLPIRGYDWLSLLTYGKWQMNGRVICSELIQIYVNELLRHSSGYLLGVDELVLPVDWLRRVTVLWEG